MSTRSPVADFFTNEPLSTLMFLLLFAEQAFGHTCEFLVIWDTTLLVWRHCNVSIFFMANLSKHRGIKSVWWHFIPYELNLWRGSNLNLCLISTGVFTNYYWPR